MGETAGKILLTILAFFLPPVVAVIKVGCSTQFWINLVLTLIGWLPGIIHALWLVWRSPSAD